MKKVIIYVENYEYGGLEKFLFDLVQNCNYEVLLLFNKENKRILKFARQNHINYQILHIRNTREIPHFKMGILNVIVYFLSSFKICLDIFLNYCYLSQIFTKLANYDNLLIINGGYPAAHSCRSAAIAAKKQSIKNIVFSILSNPTPYYENKTVSSPSPLFSLFDKMIQFTINTIIDRKVIYSVNKFHVNCDAIKINLVKLMRFHTTKIKTVYTGISIPDPTQTLKFTRIDNDFLSIVKKTGEYWFGTTGFLSSLKGQSFFLKAMSIVKKTGISNIRGLIIGEGPDYEMLRNLARKLGLDREVIFTGKYPYNISDIYRFLDAFVFTSLQEGLPYVISEAMAYKLPIISTNVGGIPEQINDGINGILVEKANPQALAKGIIWMVENYGKWREMGEISYARAKEKFSIAKMVKGLDTLIQ